MTEAEQRVRAFVDALAALCQEHGVAIVNQDEYGMAIVPFPTNSKTPGLFDIGSITPDGMTSSWAEGERPVWKEDGRL